MQYQESLKHSEVELKYTQVYHILKRYIVDAGRLPGTSAGTEIEWQNKLKVCRGTVRKATERLVQEGLLVRIRGRGLVVSETIHQQTVDPDTSTWKIPDGIITLRSHSMIELARQQVLLPLNELFDKHYLVQFSDRLLDHFSYQGQLLGLPRGFSPTVLFFNKTLFDNHGMEYPNETWTWKELMAAARQLTWFDSKNNVQHYGLNRCSFEPFVLQAGGKLFNEDFTECLLDSPEAIEGFQFWGKLHVEHKVTPFMSCGPLSDEDLFRQGRMAMAIAPRSFIASAQLRRQASFEWSFTHSPHYRSRGVTLYMEGYGILKTAFCTGPLGALNGRNEKVKELAVSLKDLVSERRQRSVCSAAWDYPALTSLGLDPAILSEAARSNEPNTVFLESLPDARPLSWVGICSEFVDMIYAKLAEIANAKKDVVHTFHEFKKQVDGLLLKKRS